MTDVKEMVSVDLLGPFGNRDEQRVSAELNVAYWQQQLVLGAPLWPRGTS